MSLRCARADDLLRIEELARAATDSLLGPFLSPGQRVAAQAFTPLDPWLIEEGRYYVVDIGGVLAAAGGWSLRQGLIHDPSAPGMPCEPGRPGTPPTARLRAMYTAPRFARQGLGRAVLCFCEAAARLSGCLRMELLATPVGRLLYQRCGYSLAREAEICAPDGTRFRVFHMGKTLAGTAPAGALGRGTDD